MSKCGQAIKAALLSTALTCAASAQGMAADLPFFGGSDPTPQIPVEFGTGWYIRGDVAYASESMSPISPDLSQSLTAQRQSNMSVGLGFGYKFNNWFRTDLVGDYRTPNRAGGNGDPVHCTTQLTTIDSFPVETAFDMCTPHGASSIRQWDILQNGYFDLGTWYGVTPYIGAGAGISLTRATNTVNYYMSNGLPYQVTTDGFYFDFDRRTSQMSYQFAWAVMAGLSYQMTENASIDIGYRYLDLGKYTATSSTGLTASKKDDVHEITIGVRYMVD